MKPGAVNTSAQMTLDTSHLWPDSDDATMAAVDLVLGDEGTSNPIEERASVQKVLGAAGSVS